MKRRNFAAVLGGAGGMVFAGTRAQAAEFTFRFAVDVPTDHHLTKRLLAAAAGIRRDSSERIELQIFPNAQLGSSTQQILLVREGAVDLCTAGDTVLADTVLVAGITALPFVFASAKDALRTMGGPLGRYVRSAIAARLNVHPFEQSWNTGFRQLVNGLRPIAAPADLRGLKIRIASSPVANSLFRALGASPAVIDAVQMYTALQTHVVDGVELPLSSIESFRMYEVQKYLSYTYHQWTGLTFIMNLQSWQRMPKNLQDLLERRIDEAALIDSGELAGIEADLAAKLRSQEMIFNQVDVAAFRDAVRKAGLYAQWRDTYGPQAWSMLEQSVGKLT